MEKTDNTYENYKSEIQEIFKNSFDEYTYISWLSKINLHSINEYEIVLSVPTVFIKEWIEREYFNDKKRKINSEFKTIKKGIKTLLIEKYNIKSVDIIVNKNEKQNIIDNNIEDNSEKIASCYDGVFTIGTELNKMFTFQNYIVGNSNKLAYLVSQSIVNEENNNYNPLFLYSEVGLGKTHLIQAICWELKNKYKNKKIVYLSAERFMSLFVKSLKDKDVDSFKKQFEYIDVLVIDDIQFLAGKKGTQNEFFYTFNTLLNENKKIIMACNKSLDNLENVDEDLKSKIKSGIIVNIDRPDYKMRYELAKKKAEIFNLKCNDSIIEYIARNIKTTCRDIEGAIKKISITQKYLNQDIDLDSIKFILKDYINYNDKVITTNKIQKIISNYYNISVEDLLSDKRNKQFSFPRQILFYICRKILKKNWTDIARENGNKNHATVIFAFNKIEKKINNNEELLKDINTIVDRINK